MLLDGFGQCAKSCKIVPRAHRLVRPEKLLITACYISVHFARTSPSAVSLTRKIHIQSLQAMQTGRSINLTFY